MLVDRERKIRYINRVEIGYTIDDALGVDAIEFISPAEREEWAVTRGLCPACESATGAGG